MLPSHLRISSSNIQRTFLFIFLSAAQCSVTPSLGQLQAGVYDFGQGRYGERRGSWTPGEWISLILLLMTICLGLAISIGLCYYVNRRQTQKSTSRLNYLKRQYVQASNASLAASDEPRILSSSAGVAPSRASRDLSKFETVNMAGAAFVGPNKPPRDYPGGYYDRQ